MKSALEITSGMELEVFDLGTVVIGRTTYTVLTGHEGNGRCFWCGGELKGKLKRYCRDHMGEYYRHFKWSNASKSARRRANYCCENCGIGEKDIPSIGYYMRSGLEIHHIVPMNGAKRAFSAFNLPWNLIALCHNCHVALHAVMKPEKPQPTIQQESITQGQLTLL